MKNISDSQNKIRLRSVYKVKPYFFNPVKGKNGIYPDCVKRVRINSNGTSEMILSEAEMNSLERDYFVPEDEIIKVIDGTAFDLNNPYERNRWRAIENSTLIAHSRNEKDANGNFIIDGSTTRYGIAELFIEIEGEISKERTTKIKLLNQAYSHITNDSFEGRLTKVKLLGKDMRYSPASDVEDFLYTMAENNAQRIIDLYTGTDTQLELLFIDCQEKRIFRKEGAAYFYGDSFLGMSKEGVLTFLKMPMNKHIFDSLRTEVYPEYAEAILLGKLKQEERKKEVVKEPVVKEAVATTAVKG